MPEAALKEKPHHAAFPLRRIWHCVSAALYIILCLKSFVHVAQYPYHNNDMVMYVAAVHWFEDGPTQGWFDHVMEEVKNEMTPAQYEKYMARMKPANFWMDVESLRQTLPIHWAKPLYVGSVYLLYMLGMPAAMGTWVVSLMSLVVLSALLFFIPPRGMDRGVWWLACAGLIFYLQPYNLIYFARLSTPDMMSLLMIVLATYGLLAWQSVRLWYVFSLFTLLTRPDSLPLLVLLALASSVAVDDRFRLPYKHVAISVGLLVAAYFTVNHLGGFYGWKIFMEYSLVNKTPYPEQLTGNFTLAHYLHHLNGTIDYVLGERMIWYLAVWTAIVVTAHLVCTRRLFTMPMALMVIAWAHVVLKTLIFAQRDGRFYYASYLLAFIGGMILIAPLLPSLKLIWEKRDDGQR